MPTTYVGSAAFNPSITIPVDGDLADANSVNVSAKAEIDTQLSLFDMYGQMMQSTCPIRIRRKLTLVVDIDPIPFIAVTEGGTWKTIFSTTTTSVGVANIEGMPGAFTPNTWYYIYAFSNGGVMDFQLSTTPPDVYGLYKNGTFSMKFLGTFLTNSGGFIIPFEKYGNFVTYEGKFTVGSGSSTTPSALNTAAAIPPSINNVPRLCKMVLDINNTANTSDQLILVGSTTPITGLSFQARAGGLDTTVFDIATDANRALFYSVSNNLTVATFSLYGYYE